MRQRRQKQGYTIVEVMIFLAVSGFMFLIAAGFISGKQARSEFHQGMNDMNAQIQQVINDVSNGIYPTNGNFTCSADALGTAPSLSNGGSGSGTNKGCTFIGKVMQFNVGTPPSSTYNIYSVIGRQFQMDSASLLPPTNFQQAKPVAATSTNGIDGVTEAKTLQWGIQLYQMYNHATPIGAFGFFNGFASTTDTNLDSGAAAPVAVAIPNSQLGQSASAIDSQVASLANPATIVDMNPEIIMCFRGGANQFGRLTIGTTDNVQGQKLNTHIQISAGEPSAGCPSS